MTADQLKAIVDAVFAELATATAGNFILHLAVLAVQGVVDNVLPAVLGKLVINAPK